MTDARLNDRPSRARTWSSGTGSQLANVPAINPLDRGQVLPADSYRPGDAVWVFRHGVWSPGTVRAHSPVAVLVDYHRPGGQGVLTDTVADLYVMLRDDPAQLEAPPGPGGDRGRVRLCGWLTSCF